MIPSFFIFVKKVMNYILFDDYGWDQMLPLTFTRPVSELRVGILKIREKWEVLLNSEISFLTREYLQVKYPSRIENDNILINSCLLPDHSIINEIHSLDHGYAIVSGDRILAVYLTKSETIDFHYNSKILYNKISIGHEVRLIDKPWQIFLLNGEEIINDFRLITNGRKSEKLSSTNNLINSENIFVEEDVKAEYITVNASAGPVYLGKNCEIMEGSLIRGPFALCKNSRIKMASKIYGPTTIGPGSVAGGEIKNSVIQGFSNKGHDGFLGNSVLGEWCNVGADSNTSNLKNTYSTIKLWNYKEEKYLDTGLMYCGLIMADHSKCGINTMFNTGTVVGVNANIVGTGYTKNFIPSFSWGGIDGFTVYDLSKALEVAGRVMSQRNLDFDDTERTILSEVFHITQKYRYF